MKTKCLAQRVLGKLGVGMVDLAVSVNNGMGVHVFRFIKDPSLAAVFAKVPRCLHSTFSWAFPEKFKDDLTTDETIAILVGIALRGHVDNIRIESLMSLCGDGWNIVPPTQSLQMRTLLMRSGCDANETLDGQKDEIKKVVPGSTGVAVAPVKKKRQPPVGGGQRAYVSAELKRRKLSLEAVGVAKLLNQEYTELCNARGGRLEAIKKTGRSAKVRPHSLREG